MSQQKLQESMGYFKDTLGEYMIHEFQNVFGANWLESAMSPPGSDALMTGKKNPKEWDIHFLINLIHLHWDQVFSKQICEKFPKSLFTVIKFYRNAWAHQHKLTDRDIYRVIDLLELVLSGLNLNSQPIEAKRAEMLAIIANENSNTVYQIAKPRFLCAGCGSYFFLEIRFECFTCGILSCAVCMVNWCKGNGKICPQCKRELNNSELLEIQSNYGKVFQS